MKSTTQTERILRHLKDYNSITTWEAIQEYGITRLSARIFDIKDMGYKIKSEIETATNRYGETVNYKRYILEV
jgi:hypothetical protein